MGIGGFRLGTSSTSYVCLNRTKRTIILDLKKRQGRATLAEFIRQSDLLVTNFLPQTVKALEIDKESLRRINPRICSVYITAFSKNDADYEQAGIDLLMQAYSGMVLIGGTKIKEFSVSPVFCVDVSTSHLATEAALAALYQTSRTGCGVSFDVSMMTAALELQLQEISTFVSEGAIREKGKEEMPSLYMDPPYGIHRTADGAVAVARTRLGLISGALNAPELLSLEKLRPVEEEREATSLWRDQVVKVVSSHLLGMKTDDAIAALRNYDVWTARVRGYRELVDDTGIMSRFVEVPLPDGKTFKCLGPTIGDNRCSAPNQFVSGFGEDSLLVLEEFGFSDTEARSLIDSGVVAELSTVPEPRARRSRGQGV
jgi:crotonobetainyl-CoA:carnitine CoA-transferase CaiB-like acyl-CoA transferase